MNHTATVMPGLQTWGFNKSDKDERIKALETSIDAINEKLSLLMRADESNASALKAADITLTMRIKHVNDRTIAELQGVANDLAKLRAWKENLLSRHPELRTTTEPPSTTRRPRRRG
jgi:CBS-domain-containing membrane protein